MEKVLEVKHNNGKGIDTYEIYAEFDLEDYTIVEPVSAKIVRNGEEMTKFGHTFAGRKLTAMDIAEMFIKDYVNCGRKNEYVYVAQEIDDFCNFNQMLLENGYPKYYFGSFGVKSDIVAYSDTNAYYINDDELKNIVIDKNNEVVTDMEDFFISAMVEDYKNGKLTIVKEYVLPWIEGYL